MKTAVGIRPVECKPPVRSLQCLAAMNRTLKAKQAEDRFIKQNLLIGFWCISLFALCLAAANAQLTNQPVSLLQRGHSGRITTLAFSSDDSLLASGGVDQTVSLWDVNSGTELAKFTENSAPITKIVFCASEQSLLWVSSDGSARYWDLVRRSPKNGLYGQTAGIVLLTAAISPDCRYAFLGNSHGSSLLWDISNPDVHDGTKLIDMEGVKSIFSGDGNTIATIDSSGELGIGNTENWTVDAIWPNEESINPLDLGFMENSRAVWLADVSGLFLLEKPLQNTRKDDSLLVSELRQLYCHGGDADNSTICNATNPNAKPRRLPLSMRPLVHFTGAVASGVSQNGRYMAIANQSNILIIKIGSTDAAVIKILPRGNAEITALSIDDDCTKLALGLASGAVQLRNVADGSEQWNLGGHKADLLGLSLSEKSTLLTFLDSPGKSTLLDFPSLQKKAPSRLISDPMFWALDSTKKNRPFPTGAPEVVKTLLDQGYALIRSSNGNLVVMRLRDEVAFPVYNIPTTGGHITSKRAAGSPPCSPRGVSIEAHQQGIEDATISYDGKRLYISCKNETILSYSLANNQYIGGERLRRLPEAVNKLNVSRDGLHLIVANGTSVIVIDMITGQQTRREYVADNNGSEIDAVFAGEASDEALIVRRDLIGIDIPHDIDWGYLVNVRTGATTKFQGDVRNVTSVDFGQAMQHTLISGSEDGVIRFWDSRTGELVHSRLAHVGSVKMVKSIDSKNAVSVGVDGDLVLSDVASGLDICRSTGLTGDNWLISCKGGQFDTPNLEDIRNLFWIFTDDPFHPLSPEIFMRDYYEPRLLPRLLAGDQFPELPPLQNLNRVQPCVRLASVTRGASADLAEVTVEMAPATGQFHLNGKLVTNTTDVYDLRLFRDGQLVGQEPELSAEVEASLKNRVVLTPEELDAWKTARQVKPGERVKLDPATGKLQKTFTVRLPHGQAGNEIKFTAYAFNENRVKSETDEKRYTVPLDVGPLHRRAYLISMGVNAYENPSWDLHFAANDARHIQKELAKRLVGYEVVPVTLISDCLDPGCEKSTAKSEDNATKASLHAALELLAAHKLSSELQSSIPPGGEKILRADPDDLVLVSISSHGYTDPDGVFYMIPSNSGHTDGNQMTDDLKQNWISSDDLSAWLKGVDAGSLVMIVDTCHSASTVDEPGFKPGPMGSRGLGQLAYDKGMRILAASQAEDVALESETLKQGLLTYALVQNGLIDRAAAGMDGKGEITLDQWLQYGVERVPQIYEQILKTGKVKALGLTSRDTPVNPALSGRTSSLMKNGFQQPSLFSFQKNKQDIILR